MRGLSHSCAEPTLPHRRILMNIQVEVDPAYSERSGQFIYVPDHVPFVDMATAISRIYIDAGFIVGIPAKLNAYSGWNPNGIPG